MNQNSVFKVLALTVFVVAVTVGLAFFMASPIPDGQGGRFALGLVPVVLAEFFLGGMMLTTMAGDEQSARHLFGLSRIYYAWCYLGFSLVAALMVLAGVNSTFIVVLHVLALTAIIILSVLGSAVADRAVASDNVHPVDSTLSGFKSGMARLASRAQLIPAGDFAVAKAAILKSQDNLRYVYVESTAASSQEDTELGACLQDLNEKLGAVEADAAKAGSVGQEVVALCARLDAVIKSRTALLARRL
ncbi:MAG: hypothetical protein RLZ85_127 [Verrucomicrobiota bacterium]|jgi:hypothetical protein